MDVSKVCPVCNTGTWDTYHALVKCSFVRRVWTQSVMGDHNGFATFFGEWWQQIVLCKKKEEVCFTTMVPWNLWNNRNDIVWIEKNNSYDWILR